MSVPCQGRPWHGTLIIVPSEQENHDHVMVMLFESFNMAPPMFPRNATKVCFPLV